MEKKLLIIATLFCVLLSFVGFDYIQKFIIDENIDKAIYDNQIDTRNQSDYVMNKVIDENSIVVLGSSELSAADDLAFPPSLFNYGNSDFNMILMGAGHLQSCAQAINVGALQNNIKNNKIVLIVSPQWFVQTGVDSQAFSSRFEEQNFVEFLKNDNISKKTKISVSDRVNTLLETDPITLERMKKYENIYLYHSINPIKIFEMSTYNMFCNAKLRFKYASEISKLNSSIDYDNYIRAENIDFASLLSVAQKIGSGECNNNEYGIYDSYFDTYIKESYEVYKGYYASSSYSSSPEYGDLRLFLDVCKDTGIEPLIISVPVNGRWYDYGEFPKSSRNAYYQNIRNICEEYNVKLVDFSEREYELYFLKDVMHLGWKGWVYVDSAVYSFFKGENIENDIKYNEISPLNISATANTNKLYDNSYKFTTKVEGNTFNAVVATLVEDDIVLDSITAVGKYSSVFLQKNESGEYTIRIRGNSNLNDEFIEYKYYLEKGHVYKLEFSIEKFQTDKIDISNINLLEVSY